MINKVHNIRFYLEDGESEVYKNVTNYIVFFDKTKKTIKFQ